MQQLLRRHHRLEVAPRPELPQRAPELPHQAIAAVGVVLRQQEEVPDGLDVGQRVEHGVEEVGLIEIVESDEAGEVGHPVHVPGEQEVARGQLSDLLRREDRRQTALHVVQRGVDHLVPVGQAVDPGVLEVDLRR